MRIIKQGSPKTIKKIIPINPECHDGYELIVCKNYYSW